MNAQADTPLATKARPCGDNPVVPVQMLSWRRALRLAVGAVAAFHLAYTFPPLGFLIVAFPFFLFQLADLPTARQAFYFGFLSYRRVTDELIRQGAQAIIAPTMDVADWGGHQHRLHARVAPVRAAEYGVPIFRVCSSGISQLIDGTGRVAASAPFPGEQATIAGPLEFVRRGHLPLDHWLAPLSVLVTAVIVLWLSGKALLSKFSKL